ncbi:MAG TPA: radical SAM protein [Edaphobacter sp.]|nr:radical SAM protein [Edaphobacter sp.]
MKSSEVMQAWKSILLGRRPSLSIELTRECPLRCPGCYAYDPAHLGANGTVTLRQLSDYKEDALVKNVLRVVDEHQPLHVSLVGGDPLVRYRELEAILPELDRRGIHTQIVTSAFRPIPAHWADFKRLNVVVSIDGLQPEHDKRRAPATYERILKNLAEARVTIHCTITGQIANQPGYLERFLQFWTDRPEAKKVWMSIFTPQLGATDPEILSPPIRAAVIRELLRLRPLYPILDMHESALQEFLNPPHSPADCIFARTTHIISADLKTVITPCQFGGNPDCSQCGCIASMGLAAVGHHKVVGGLTAGHLFKISDAVGRNIKKLSNPHNNKRAAIQ